MTTRVLTANNAITKLKRCRWTEQDSVGDSRFKSITSSASALASASVITVPTSCRKYKNFILWQAAQTSLYTCKQFRTTIYWQNTRDIKQSVRNIFANSHSYDASIHIQGICIRVYVYVYTGYKYTGCSRKNCTKFAIQLIPNCLS